MDATVVARGNSERALCRVPMKKPFEIDQAKVQRMGIMRLSNTPKHRVQQEWVGRNQKKEKEIRGAFRSMNRVR